MFKKLKIIFQYIKFWWFGLLMKKSVFRYKTCFIFHERQNTLINRIRKHRIYEPLIEEFLYRILPDDGLFIDIGANIGLIALPLLKAKPHAQAFLFEPSPIALYLLKKNLYANNLENRANVYNCALGNKNNDKVKFAINKFPDCSMDGFLYTGRAGGFDTIYVTQRKLDDIVQNLNIDNINIIKIDCEGAELLVLQGAKKSINYFKPIIVMEFCKQNYSKYNIHAKDLWEWTLRTNYLILTLSMTVLDQRDLEIHIGAMNEEQFILIHRYYKWCGI